MRVSALYMRPMLAPYLSASVVDTCGSLSFLTPSVETSTLTEKVCTLQVGRLDGDDLGDDVDVRLDCASARQAAAHDAGRAADKKWVTASQRAAQHHERQLLARR